MKVGVVIQARIGSNRLPGKVLLPIAGKVMLDHVLGRLSLLKYPVKVVVATSDTSADDVIAAHCRLTGIDVFRGNEYNVLDRYYQCALKYSFEHIVRLTADNPFTDIEELQRLIELHLAQCNDYSHSFGIMPQGVGAEIFTYAALERSIQQGHAPNHREHVNEYIEENPDLFRIGILDVPAVKRFPSVRLTVDTDEDYHRACYVAEHASGSWAETEEAVMLCLHSA